jgi:hypothetical protein
MPLVIRFEAAAWGSKKFRRSVSAASELYDESQPITVGELLKEVDGLAEAIRKSVAQGDLPVATGLAGFVYDPRVEDPGVDQ